MSFLNIKNPNERDAIVKEYLATIKRLQQKDLNEKARDLVRTEDIERTLEPVVRTTKQSTDAITKELIPIKDEIKALNERLENRENNRRRRPNDEKEEEEEEKEPVDDIVKAFYNRVPEDKLDKYFGIVREDDRYKMGSKYVQVDELDLIVDHKRYAGTRGFWSLIMEARPEGYSREDFVKYRDLIAHTNAMAYPNNVSSSSRVRSTKKWRSIFPKFDELEEEGEEEVSPLVHRTPLREEASPSSSFSRSMTPAAAATSHGEGIVQFLPNDIKGLETKLNILLGEYRAGNRSSTTRNEIVPIADELLRRKGGISRKEYKDINNFLQ